MTSNFSCGLPISYSVIILGWKVFYDLVLSVLQCYHHFKMNYKTLPQQMITVKPQNDLDININLQLQCCQCSGHVLYFSLIAMWMNFLDA